MTKKTIIIISLLISVAGFIITGIFGENAFEEQNVKATYLHFDTDNELINVSSKGLKTMNLPNLLEGESKTYFLEELISYDENATKSIYEISTFLKTNYEDIVTLNLLTLSLNCGNYAKLPADLTIRITIQTNDGSDLSDSLTIYHDSSGESIDW